MALVVPTVKLLTHSSTSGCAYSARSALTGSIRVARRAGI